MDSSQYEMGMPGYLPYQFRADNLGDAVNLALVSIGRMRRDEQARARASARGKKLQEALKAKNDSQHTEPAKGSQAKPAVKSA